MYQSGMDWFADKIDFKVGYPVVMAFALHDPKIVFMYNLIRIKVVAIAYRGYHSLSK